MLLRSTMIKFFSCSLPGAIDAIPSRVPEPSIALLLQKKSKPISISECKQIHAKLVVSRAISETHVANTLLSLYTKCNALDHADLLFDKMPRKNVVTWTSMISAYVHDGSFGRAMKMFKGMLETGDKPNKFTFSIAVRACTGLSSRDLGQQIHCLMVQLGLESNEFAGSVLVDMYFKIGNDLDDACRVFDGLFTKDRVTWNVMISAVAQVGDSCRVSRLFSDMRVFDQLEPNDFTFTSLLRCCCLLREVEQIHALAVKFHAEDDVVVGSALVDFYGKCGDMASSWKVFDSIEEKDKFVWSSIISGHTRNGRGEEAIILFREMCRQGMRPDQHALSSTLKGCAENGDLNTAVQVHAQMIKNGCGRNCFVASVLLALYADSGNICEAENLFRKIDMKDIVAWNSMILGYAQMKEGSLSCIQMFQELCWTDLLKPDAGTLIAVLKSCQSKSDMVTGVQIHSVIVKSSQSLETPVGNALVHMYSECGTIDDAYKSFNDLVEKDETSWSSIVSCYQQNGYDLEALQLCKQMLANGVHFTSYSLPSCLSACSKVVAIDVGKQFHAFIIKCGFHRDVYVGSSIIDMYAKCGDHEESRKVFNDEQRSNEVTYNAMISGLAQHGKALEAIEIFSEMEKMNLMPNHITFLALLSACSHAGYTEKSLYFFNLMHKKYRIRPESEHYSCLVDAYGRAGKLEEAYQFIKNDGSVLAWRTLLSSCRIYANTKIAEKSAREIIELDADDHSSYVILSNIYSGEGKWEEAMKLRQKMTEIGLKKYPASSRLIY
ncbi:pentatricopeptide repeat-containing protein At4g39530-like [Juglans microcarpa x Juglans regia]|uniref:pentatricopeptide repeat-containing protein At4g39530-like n=1 Tax=Juglans microcarpa x Juglans regia TaxID=2249226 RepID=UPI001B7DE831|nr:pentatricopeptide repeat-containing protein At4g39530-like [Juglans microcarpa x Juglans regia]